MIFKLHYTITNRIRTTTTATAHRLWWKLCQYSDNVNVWLTQRGEYLAYQHREFKRHVTIKRTNLKRRIPELTALPFYVMGYSVGFVVKSILWLKDSTIAGYDKARTEDEYV